LVERRQFGLEIGKAFFTGAHPFIVQEQLGFFETFTSADLCKPYIAFGCNFFGSHSERINWSGGQCRGPFKSQVFRIVAGGLNPEVLDFATGDQLGSGINSRGANRTISLYERDDEVRRRRLLECPIRKKSFKKCRPMLGWRFGWRQSPVRIGMLGVRNLKSGPVVPSPL
jgi:hypothetical protein